MTSNSDTRNNDESLRSICSLVKTPGPTDGLDVSFKTIRTCAAAACRLCDLWQRVILDLVGGQMPHFFKGFETEAHCSLILDNLEYNGNSPEGGSLSVQRTAHGREIPTTFQADLVLFTDMETDSAKMTVQGLRFPKRNPFGPLTNSERSMQAAEVWLQQCLTRHSCGTSRQAPDRMPKRLLNVSVEPVRVIETTGHIDKYVSLSHRWGSPEQPRLMSTVFTIRDHMQRGIPWASFPRTFQDSIWVCRRMKIDFLWIDSLCILQQCPGLDASQVAATKADFVSENAAMARIYQNSCFTIAADISTSMHSGIFNREKGGACHPFSVLNDVGSVSTVYVTRSTPWHTLFPRDIETRAWTFQELLLPPRVLHFDEFDLAWRCQELEDCECGFYGRKRANPTHWRQSLTEIAAKPVPHGRLEALKWWITIVQHYVPRSLSNPSDRLPALSGLAQLYRMATGDTYLAGLWESSLLHELCWYNHWTDRDSVFESPPLGRRHAQFGAPSWSWASIGVERDVTCYTWPMEESNLNIGHVRPFIPPQRTICTLHKAFSQPKTRDPTGEVGNCRIELRVTLITATIEIPGKTYDFRDAPEWTITNKGDGTEVAECYPDTSLEESGLKLGDEVYCAPMVEILAETRSERACLVLQRLQEETYHRVGFCVLTAWNPDLGREKALEVESQYRETNRFYFKPSDVDASKHTFAFNADSASLITII